MNLGPYQLIKKVADGIVGPILLCEELQGQRRFLIQELPAIRDSRAVHRLEEFSRRVAGSGAPDAASSGPLVKLSDGRYLWACAVPTGQSLADMLAACVGQRCGGALPILAALAEQLARWHAQGVWHLALHPALIYVNWNYAQQGNPDVRILGTGLAMALHLSDLRAAGATSSYLAPEQHGDATQQSLDGSADIYALGVLHVQVLLGVPLDGKQSKQHLEEYLAVLERQNVAGELLRRLRRMIAQRPVERPAIREVIEVLRSVIDEAQADETVLHSRLSPVPPLQAAQVQSQRDSACDGKIGTLCGNFRLLRKLGEGGMGVVYEAEHCQIGRRAAVKIMHPEFAENAEFASRFLNEARAVNIVRHPGLVEIFEYGQLPDGTLFIVMEFLEGQTLSDRFVKSGRQSPLLPTLHLAYQIAQALDAAHEKNIVHRDLKPENIMLINDPLHPDELRVKILDFGIAKLARRSTPIAEARTRVGAYMGTPLYMAPEQHGRAEEADGRADVFAFGVILHELLAGKSPFQGSSLSLLGKSAPPLNSIRSDLPVGLSELVQRMMALETAKRPTMKEVLQTLSNHVRKPQKDSRPKLALLGCGAVLCVALVALFLAKALLPPSLEEARSKALEVIKASLRAHDDTERVLALAAIAESKDSSLQSLVLPLLATEKLAIQEAAASALGEMGSIESTRNLLPLLSAAQEPLRLSAARALARLSNPNGQKALRDILEQGADQSRIEAAVNLLEFGDLSGAALLHRIISRSTAADSRALAILSGLAKAGDVEARHQLAEQLAGLAGSPQGPRLAFALARIGDRSARLHLEELAARSGPAQLLAARLLAGLGDTRGYELLVETARNGQKTEPERAIAIDGLADVSNPAAAAPLAKIIDERGVSARIRLLAAGAILELAAGERAQLAEQSLTWARAALGSDSASTRELAAALLGELESPKTISPLAQALKDREREVRRSAARALGKKRAREALEALTEVLDDADEELRAISARSIGTIAVALKEKGGSIGEKDADKQVLTRLQKLAQSRSEQDRVLAAGTLFQMGDRSQRATLEASLLSSNALVRRLAVEMLDSESRALVNALSDGDRLVRYAAARRLAARGAREAIPVLREFVSAGDIEGLTACGILKRLGESVEQPPGLQNLLTAGGLSERFAVVEVVSDLPPPLAYQLLLVAANDPASVIRRRAADTASRLFIQTKQLVFLRLLRSLINDPDAAVRSKARELVALIPAEQQKQATDTLEIEDTKPVRAATPIAEQGQLILVGEEGVLVQIDKMPAQAISNKPMVLSVGKHRISYLGGQQEVSLVAGGSVTVKVPTTMAEQLIQNALDALKSRELVRAQAYLDRNRRLMLRVGTKPITRGDHTYVQAKVDEAKNQLQQAMTEYVSYQKLPGSQQRPEYLADAKNTIARLAPRMGKIQIFTMREGRCQLEEIYLPPGDQVISLGPGQTKVISVYAGVTTPVRACQ